MSTSQLLRLDLPRPFSLAYTVQVLRRIPANVVDRWEGGAYLRALPISSGNRLVVARQLGSPDDGQVEVRVLGAPPSEADTVEITRTLRRVLGLDVDLQPLIVRFQQLPALVPIVERLRGMRPPRFPTLFEAITSTVPFQQVSLESGVALLSRLVHAFGSRIQVDECAGWVFPSAPAIAGATLDELRACGLSGAKALTLHHAAVAIVDGQLSEAQVEALPTDQAVGVLDDLPGVGPWTAAVILLRGLGRLDVFPHGDSGIRRSLAAVMGRSQPLSDAEERDLVAGLGPARGLLYFYSLGWRLAQRGQLDDGGLVELAEGG